VCGDIGDGCSLGIAGAQFAIDIVHAMPAQVLARPLVPPPVQRAAGCTIDTKNPNN